MDYGATVKPAEVSTRLSNRATMPFLAACLVFACAAERLLLLSPPRARISSWCGRIALRGATTSKKDAKRVCGEPRTSLTAPIGACACLLPPNSNAGMTITCAKIQTLRLFLSTQESSSRVTSPILVLQCRYKAVGFVLVVGHNPPPAGVCHLVLADLLDNTDAITAQINTAGES